MRIFGSSSGAVGGSGSRSGGGVSRTKSTRYDDRTDRTGMKYALHTHTHKLYSYSYSYSYSYFYSHAHTHVLMYSYTHILILTVDSDRDSEEDERAYVDAREKHFLETLECKGLHVFAIEGDGNCLFRYEICNTHFLPQSYSH
jgi:hypothetical protein